MQALNNAPFLGPPCSATKNKGEDGVPQTLAAYQARVTNPWLMTLPPGTAKSNATVVAAQIEGAFARKSDILSLRQLAWIFHEGGIGERQKAA